MERKDTKPGDVRGTLIDNLPEINTEGEVRIPLPNDGTYSYGFCDGPGHDDISYRRTFHPELRKDEYDRLSAHLVRRVPLDRNPEGAGVYLCYRHFNDEMRHRMWANQHGVENPWDVYEFFDPLPGKE